MTVDARPTLQAPDDDPYLWLEEIDGVEATVWADAQSAQTLVDFGDETFEANTSALLAIYDEPSNIPYVTRRGELIYNFWIDAEQPKGLWRRTTLESFRTDAPEWDVLLDVDALAASEDEDWVWAGATTIPVTHDRAILRLSRGGGDAVVLREFDVEARSFVADGFNLPEAKGGIEWVDRDTLLLSSAIGDEMATTSGYARTVRQWTRGTDYSAAEVVFETDASNMAVFTSVDHGQAEERIFFGVATGFFDRELSVGTRSGPERKIDLPSDATIWGHDDWYVIQARTDWQRGKDRFLADMIVGFRLSELLDGNPKFQVLYEPHSRKSADGFFWADGALILPILDNLRPTFEVWSPADEGWTKTRLKDVPEVGMAHAWRLDTEGYESNGDLLLNTQDPLTPATLSLLSDGVAPSVLKRAPRHFDPSGLVVTQHEAVSIDGVAIPYTQVGPEKTDGNAPVHMTAYGGFGISRLAGYGGAIGKLWLERGGVSVTAQIRGGGEFGTPWHDAGRREGKALSHDDFAAIAADLVTREVTQPKRIAAEGGSNGGILISNMLTRYPDRFGALFCTIPLIDMRRYTKLLAGASWIAEYGDPDVAEDWAFLKTYSAYHTAVPGNDYPPILLATTRRDDRVHPGHARKMAAKLQAMGYPAWFYEPAAGGHGYGKDNAERAAFVALGLRFLSEKIGWDAGA